MSLFSKLYLKTLQWSAHKQAPKYLGAMSFAESSFFPIPPDVMLMPMVLAKPDRALFYAWIATFFSVLGGLLGYAIGFFAMDLVVPWLVDIGYDSKFAAAQQFFVEYGVWVVFIAGFSPIPYKVFTITAGASAMPLLPFVIASFIGRGARFLLVSLLMKYGGPKLEPFIRKWVDWLGWVFVGLVIFYVSYKLV